jgi:hypothetical protein
MREDVVASKISAKTPNPTAWYEIDPHDVTCFILFLYFLFFMIHIILRGIVFECKFVLLLLVYCLFWLGPFYY